VTSREERIVLALIEKTVTGDVRWTGPHINTNTARSYEAIVPCDAMVAIGCYHIEDDDVYVLHLVDYTQDNHLPHVLSGLLVQLWGLVTSDRPGSVDTRMAAMAEVEAALGVTE